MLSKFSSLTQRDKAAVVGVGVIGVVGVSYALYRALSSDSSSSDSSSSSSSSSASRGTLTKHVSFADTLTTTAPSSTSTSTPPSSSSASSSSAPTESSGTPSSSPAVVPPSPLSALSLGDGVQGAVISPELKKQIVDLLEEVLSSADVSEAEHWLSRVLETARESLGPDAQSVVAVELTKRAFDICLDRSSQRSSEVMYTLLSSLETRGVVLAQHLSEGLDVLLHRLPDLRLDAPRAGGVFAEFVANLVLLNAVAEDFILDRWESVGLRSPLPANIPDPTDELLKGTSGEIQVLMHAMSILEGRVSASVVRQMKGSIRGIVTSFLSAGKISALNALIYDLAAPHYHFEVIVQLVRLSLDLSAADRELTSHVILSLSQSRTISADQIHEGFLRLLRSVDELVLDNPGAAALLAVFVSRAINDGVLSDTFLDDLPPTVLPTASHPIQPTRNSFVRPSPSNAAASAPTDPTSLPPLAPVPLGRTLSSSSLTPMEEAARSSALRETLSKTRRALAAGTDLSWGCLKWTDLTTRCEKLVETFFSGGDEEAAVRAAQDLNSPDMLHELVYQICGAAMSKPFAEAARGSGLLTMLRNSKVLSESQFERGIFRVFESMEFAEPGEHPDTPSLSVPWLLSLLLHSTRTGVLAEGLFDRFPEHLACRIEVDEEEEAALEMEENLPTPAGPVDVDTSSLSAAAFLRLKFLRTISSDSASTTTP